MVRIISGWINNIIHVYRATFSRAANHIAGVLMFATEVRVGAGPEEIPPIGCAIGTIYLPSEMLYVTIILTSSCAALAIGAPVLLHREQSCTNFGFLRPPQV